MKTFALSLIFSAFMLISNSPIARANNYHTEHSDSSKVANLNEDPSTSQGGEFDFDFDDPFFFNDKVVVNIYDQDDELIYSNSFTKEEYKNNSELKAMLKKSEFLLSIDNQYYYSSKQ